MKNLDDVLKKSLTPAESEEGPDFWLNQNILKRADRQERGAKTMKKRTYRPTKAVAALVIALSISGSAVFAVEKTNLFGNLFGETNMGPVESYVTIQVQMRIQRHPTIIREPSMKCRLTRWFEVRQRIPELCSLQ